MFSGGRSSAQRGLLAARRELLSSLAIWLVPLALTAAGCSGGMGALADDDVAAQSSVASSPAGQATMPTERLDPDRVFLQADQEFKRGNFAAAHERFGTLYLIAPSYQGGVAASALEQTSARLGYPTDVVLARLDFLRSAYYGEFAGPRSAWPPPQERDFRQIVTCFDRTILGDARGGIQAAAPVRGAPLPGFDAAARACIALAEQYVERQARREAAEQAFASWQANYPCLTARYEELYAAYQADDWEAFAEIYPAYQVCAVPVREILDSGLLEGDPRVGLDHDRAWTIVSEIAGIMEDNRQHYESVRDALNALDDDAEYNRLVIEWEGLAADETRILNQIDSLERARANLSGPERQAMDAQLDVLRSNLRGVRNSMREVMGRINSLRRAEGLSSRERP